MKEVTVKTIELRRPEMGELADIYSIETELRIARDYCLEAKQLRMDDKREALIVDALVMAAVVRYTRCFQPTGKRISLTRDDLSGLSGQLQKWHQYFKDIRDKHIAHSINVYEQSYVRAALTSENGTRQPFTALLPGNERVVFSNKNAAALHELIDAVLKVAFQKRRDAEQAALGILNSLPEDVIQSFEPRQPMNVGPKDVAKARQDRINVKKQG